MEKTLKQLLIEKGLEESKITNHYSDLYCKVCPESTEAIGEYESILGFKPSVTTFIDQIDKELWYDVAGGYSEYFNNK